MSSDSQLPALRQLLAVIATSEDQRTPSMKRAERDERRALKRQRKMGEATREWGLVQLGLALVAGGVAVWQPDLWWCGWVAFGAAVGGVRQLRLVAQRELAKPGSTVESPLEDEKHEVDALCDGLLEDLRASPQVVRDFLSTPEITIEELRGAAKAIDQRRRALGQAAEQARGSLSSRFELTQRFEGASDLVARGHFEQALAALAGQEAAVQQLESIRERLDAQYTSLLMQLHELRSRIALARAPAGLVGPSPNLNDNTQRLNAELEAIAVSLQEVSGVGLPGRAPLKVR